MPGLETQDILNRIYDPVNAALRFSGAGLFSDFQAAEVVTSEQTTTLTFTDLTTVGPSVTTTITATGKVLVVWSAFANSNTQFSGASMGFAASGANVIAASANENFFWESPDANLGGSSVKFQVLSSLSAGSTTFTAKYEAVTSGTATFSNRWIMAFTLR